MAIGKCRKCGKPGMYAPDDMEINWCFDCYDEAVRKIVGECPVCSFSLGSEPLMEFCPDCKRRLLELAEIDDADILNLLCFGIESEEDAPDDGR
jgi:hypothetical protein